MAAFAGELRCVTGVIPAKWFTAKRRGGDGTVNLIVLHTAETGETKGAARGVARYLARRPANAKASAHFVVDRDEVIQGVRLNDIAFAAPGANPNGIQVELVGRAGQTDKGWADPYSVGVLARAAELVAELCRRFKIGPGNLQRVVSIAELKRGAYRGVTGHVMVSKAFHRSDHWDPGPKFPYARFLAMVRADLERQP